MRVVKLTVTKIDGMWCVKVDDRRRVFHLGRNTNYETVVAYANRLAAMTLAGGDEPVIETENASDAA